MDLSIHSVVRYGRRYRPVRLDVRITSGLPSITVAGATIGAIRELAHGLKDAFETADEAWPWVAINARVSPWGAPDSIRQLELPMIVALMASEAETPTTSSPRTIAAWGTLPTVVFRDPVAPGAILSVRRFIAAEPDPRPIVRPIRRLSDVRPMLAMTNGPR